MDKITDVQKTDKISKFYDDQIVRTNPFGENKPCERAYRRAERIAAALHLLTNHVPADEQVRANVRLHAQQLLSDILNVREHMRTHQSPALLAAQSTIRHLISLVRILVVAGYASAQNGGTMIAALDELGNFLAVSQKSSLADTVSLSREEMFDTAATLLPQRPVRERKEHVGLSDKEIDKGHIEKRQLNARSQSVMDVLRSGGELGIKDICSNLPEYSEKMIQRELLDLTLAGVVRKKGLKRWSKYSLAS